MSQSIATEAAETQTTIGANRDRIIRKIKRCLALGESCNANEAEMAMRQAQAMMRTYRLTEIDLHIDSVGSEMRNTGMIRMAAWQRSLAGTAAKAFGCKLLMSHCKGSSIAFEFIGVMPGAELAAYTYDSLLTQVKIARKKFQNDHVATRRAGDDFCTAWVYAISTKVKAFAEENHSIQGQTNALVVMEKREEAAINQWITVRHGKVPDRKEVGRTDYNYAAIQHGLKAGQDAHISRAVSKNNDDQLRIA